MDVDLHRRRPHPRRFFVFAELPTESPLIQVAIFRIRAFSVENLVLLISMMAFIPVFFFSSEYAQIALHKTASEAGLFLLFFFSASSSPPRSGAASSTGKEPSASSSSGAHRGRRLRLVGLQGNGPRLQAGADLGRRGGGRHGDDAGAGQHLRGEPGRNLSYGEATGITQTIRNYGASLGLAAGHHPLDHLPFAPHGHAEPHGCPPCGDGGRPHLAVSAGERVGVDIPHYVSVDFAHATQVVLYVMCGIMAAAGVIALFGLHAGGRRPCRSIRSPSPRPPRATRGRRGRLVRPRARVSRLSVGQARNLAAGCSSLHGWSRQEAEHGAPLQAHRVRGGRRRDGGGARDRVQRRQQGPQAVHNVEGNKATIDSFTQNLQSDRARRSRPPTRPPAARRPPSCTPSIPRAADWPSTTPRRAPTRPTSS